MKHKRLWILLIALLVAFLVWLAFFWTPIGNEKFQARLQLEKTPTGGNFSLNSPSGRVALNDYRGKVVLVYFGYTFCPDICPTSLSTLAQALSMLTPPELEKVQSFFISVDPERDTMHVLKIYAPFFHPNIVGLSGTPEEIAEVARKYGARYMKQKPNADGLYSVDHSASTYAISPNGKLAASLPHGTSPQKLVDTIRSLLKDNVAK